MTINLFSIDPPPARGEMVSLLDLAVQKLAERGLTATRADLPGLWNVSGHPELTVNQVLALAFPTA